MKFTVEIPEQKIQTMLDDMVRQGNYELRGILQKAIIEALQDELHRLLKTKFSILVEHVVEKEIKKVTEQKLSGWVKRRVKEMLETVRQASQLTKDS